MLDKLLASISLLGLIAFMMWVAVRVMEPDLWIVSILILTIAIIFIRDELKAGGSHLEGETSSDQRDS